MKLETLKSYHKNNYTNANQLHPKFGMRIKNNYWWRSLQTLAESSPCERELLQKAETFANTIELGLANKKGKFSTLFEEARTSFGLNTDESLGEQKAIFTVLSEAWEEGNKIPAKLYEAPSQKPNLITRLKRWLFG